MVSACGVEMEVSVEKHLLLTIPCENGELYSTIDSRRIKLADCTPRIEIYEMSLPVSILGGSCKVKQYRAALILCDDMDFTRRIDDKYLGAVSSFVLSTEVQRKDGVFERLNFCNLQPVDIELGGTWTFEINEPAEKIKRLLEL